MFAASDRKVTIGRVKRNERRDTKMQGYGKPDRQKTWIKRGVFISPSLRASSLERSSTWVVLSLSHTHCLVSFSSRRRLGLVSTNRNQLPLSTSSSRDEWGKTGGQRKQTKKIWFQERQLKSVNLWIHLDDFPFWFFLISAGLAGFLAYCVWCCWLIQLRNQLREYKGYWTFLFLYLTLNYHYFYLFKFSFITFIWLCGLESIFSDGLK